MKPMAIDLFCGLGGWTEGLLAEGYDVVGFDIERHDYGTGGYPAQLVLQDILTVHGKQFKDAALIVASPPCQEYSYMAMPWSRAKTIQAEYLSGQRDTKKLTALFDACFRIQREASEAAGRHIPMVVENVRGAQKWVGRARWNFGSFYLWGDVPALMPMTRRVMKNNTGGSWFGVDARSNATVPNNARDELAGRKLPGNNSPRMWSDREIKRLCDAGIYENGCKNFTPNGEPFGKNRGPRLYGYKSKARKAASAVIAKIPLPLVRYIAQVYKPTRLFA